MSTKHVVLVEGSDDYHVVRALCGRHELGRYEIKPQDGVETLLKNLSVHLRGSDVSTLAIVVDADEDPRKRSNAIQHQLQLTGYADVSIALNAAPTIICPPSEESLLPRVGVWIMPNNKDEGTLEHFLAQMMPPTDALYTHARQVLKELPQPPKFPSERRLKAQLHTWLAWQKEPGKPYGQAITNGSLNADAPLGNDFASWFRALFELDAPIA